MTHHLLHRLFSSSFSLTLTPCCSNAIIIPAYPIFFKGVKCTWDETFSFLVSVSLFLTVSLSLFLSLSLPPSILSQFQSLHHVSNVCEGDDNDSHVEYSHHAATALCSAGKKNEPQGCGREQKGAQIWQEGMGCVGVWDMFCLWNIHWGPYMSSCRLPFTII